MPRSLRLRLAASPEEAKRLRNELHAWLLDAGINGTTGHDITLAVDEAFVNAIEHPIEPSGPAITVDGEITEDQVVVSITDSGRWQPQVDPDREHYGHDLMHALMSHVQVETKTSGTRVTLRKAPPV